MLLNPMKAKCIQSKTINLNKLIESNESKVHSNKANWFKWSFLNQMKAMCIQTKLIDSYKPYWIKWKRSAFEQS